MKVSVVNSAGGSFCCNYATDVCVYGNYASDNVCRIFASFQVLLSVTGILVDLYLYNNYASDCFCCSYAVRSFCSTYAGDSFCSKYVGDNFYCNYADESLYCSYAVGIFLQGIMHMTASIVIMQVTFLYSYVGDSFK